MLESMISWRGAMCKARRALLSVITILSTHNSLASPDAAREDDAPVMILALGTSLTVNYQWPHELAKQLSRCLARKVKIEVLASAGANSSQATKQFSSRNNRRPDIVLIEFATNDADLLDGVGLDKSRSNHKELFALIREDAPHAQLMMMTMNPVFGLRGWIRPQLSEYYENYRKLAANNNVVLVDIVPIWSGILRGTDYRLHLPDGLHPTQTAANRVILLAVRSKIGGLYRINEPKACLTNP
jgi:acyl-CoA thioesterase-1